MRGIGSIAIWINVVLSSPLKRAIRTALVAYPEHKIKVDTKLREIDAATGMHKEDMEKFISEAAPNRKLKVDLSGIHQTKPWWPSKESPEEAAQRVQRALGAVQKLTSKGKKVAIVAHGGVFRSMVGQLKPFPKEQWGSARGWPRNLSPYYARFLDAPEGAPATTTTLKVVPATRENATLVLVRHAHSRAQAANTLKKRIEKFNTRTFSPQGSKADAAKVLNAQIKRFNAVNG